jgi:hypothetical protein
MQQRYAIRAVAGVLHSQWRIKEKNRIIANHTRREDIVWLRQPEVRRTYDFWVRAMDASGSLYRDVEQVDIQNRFLSYSSRLYRIGDDGVVWANKVMLDFEDLPPMSRAQYLGSAQGVVRVVLASLKLDLTIIAVEVRNEWKRRNVHCRVGDMYDRRFDEPSAQLSLLEKQRFSDQANAALAYLEIKRVDQQSMDDRGGPADSAPARSGGLGAEPPSYEPAALSASNL